MGLPWNFGTGFWEQLPVGFVVPSEKIGVRLEPLSGFGGIYFKIHEKPAFFGFFVNKVLKKTIRYSHTAVGQRPLASQ